MKKWLDKLQDGAQFDGLTNQGFDYNSAWGGAFQSGGNMNYYKAGLDFEPKTISQDGSELTKLDQLTNFSNYNKPTKGGWLDQYEEGGIIPVSSQGVYDYPEQEVIVPTLDGKITMNQVKYPIFGIDELGNKKLMKPNKNYQFPGKVIHEIPKLKKNEKN